MSQSTNGKMLKGRDLITVGIFSAIYFVINFVFMLMSGFHPMIWILIPALIALFTGVPFMLMCAKVTVMCIARAMLKNAPIIILDEASFKDDVMR